jgi:hypothetical protein
MSTTIERLDRPSAYYLGRVNWRVLLEKASANVICGRTKSASSTGIETGRSEMEVMDSLKKNQRIR